MTKLMFKVIKYAQDKPDRNMWCFDRNSSEMLPVFRAVFPALLCMIF